MRASTKDMGSAATSREDDGTDVKSIIEAYIVVSARNDIRECEYGDDMITVMKSDLVS